MTSHTIKVNMGYTDKDKLVDRCYQYCQPYHMEFDSYEKDVPWEMIYAYETTNIAVGGQCKCRDMSPLEELVISSDQRPHPVINELRCIGCNARAILLPSVNYSRAYDFDSIEYLLSCIGSRYCTCSKANGLCESHIFAGKLKRSRHGDPFACKIERYGRYSSRVVNC